VVPAAATAQSAFGCANSSLGLTRERPVYLRVASDAVPQAAGLKAVHDTLVSLEADVREGLKAAGARGTVSVERVLAIRYRGQTNALDIAIASGAFNERAYEAAVARFERQYESLFGRGATYTRAGFEILSARAIGQGSLPPPASKATGEPLKKSGSRPVVFDDPAQPLDTAIYRTVFPPPNTRVRGPALIEFPGQSVVVPPRGVARADAFGNLHVSIAR
jgi:N-methylhydantoinase A